jgi:hypothetical protein
MQARFLQMCAKWATDLSLVPEQNVLPLPCASLRRPIYKTRLSLAAYQHERLPVRVTDQEILLRRKRIAGPSCEAQCLAFSRNGAPEAFL